MRKVDPLPESLEGIYNYQRDDSHKIKEIVLTTEHKIKECERGIETASLKKSVEHAIKFGGQVLEQRDAMQGSPLWPEVYVEECNNLLVFVKELIASDIAGWIPRQSCQSAALVADFRRKTESQARSLSKLDFPAQAQALTQQTQRCIQSVDARQAFSLTLAQCDDYPRQPEPKESTSVRNLRDEIALGDNLVVGIQKAAGVLTPEEIAAHMQAIHQHQDKLRVACKRQEDTLTAVYALAPHSHDELQETLTKINRLRAVFVGTRDESEVNELAVQLDRILSDLRAWETADVSVERLEELLTNQIELQLNGMTEFLGKKDIDSAWDMASIYGTIAHERLAVARLRSAEWIGSRVAHGLRINSLDRTGCAALERELRTAPTFLAASDAAQVIELSAAIRRRGTDLDELERRSKVAAWQQDYLDLSNVERLDAHATQRLLERLRTPPCELRSEEQTKLAPIAATLTDHLDRLSLDELMTRIERLLEPQQRQIFDRLFVLLKA